MPLNTRLAKFFTPLGTERVEVTKGNISLLFIDIYAANAQIGLPLLYTPSKLAHTHMPTAQ